VKTFTCACGNPVYFESSQCSACARVLAFLPDILEMSALERDGENRWRALHPGAAGGVYRRCQNYLFEQVCNWVMPASDVQPYCRACRLNHVIPDLSEPKNYALWYRMERAKRRLLYTLLKLDLPVVGQDVDPQRGLRFDFLANPKVDFEFSYEVADRERMITGHCEGLIRINVAEADPSMREEMREKMPEPYRTLLGHFRHEIGHYYWEHLVRETTWIEGFRELFGDERQDYGAGLQRYYIEGAPAGWEQGCVSACACVHPWEDWAETWAHYLLMVDTLETAYDFGFVVREQKINAPVLLVRGLGSKPEGFDALLQDWGNLTLAMNALHRSMGMPDPYPFVLAPRALEKLRFVHRVITLACRSPHDNPLN
jgi:Uncharacterized protein conserved in bacteria